jgi:hypothetical protein
LAEARTLQGRVVVDTDILAYCVLGTEPFREEVAWLLSMPLEMIAPDSWQREFLNVLRQAIRFERAGIC